MLGVTSGGVGRVGVGGNVLGGGTDEKALSPNLSKVLFSANRTHVAK